MRLAARLGLAFVLANVAAWLLVRGEAALSLIMGVELVFLLVARQFAVGYGDDRLEARLNILTFVSAALFMMVVAVRIGEVLAG